MASATATLHCPTCQTANLEGNRFCQHCGAVLPKRYLWAVGAMAEQLQPGQLLEKRYLVNAAGVLLDTQPGNFPTLPGLISPLAMPYLRLMPYRLHVPQPYGCVYADPPVPNGEILLLERGAIVTTGTQPGVVLPELASQWSEASGMRQLNWLRQLAQLWQPFQTEQVVYSLLTPAVLRVDRGWVRLLELVTDAGKPPATLMQLGQCWSGWIAYAQPEVRPFLSQVCQWLLQGDITTADHLVNAMDWGLGWLEQFQVRHIQVCTASDRGPTRQRNEDACYPPSGSTVQHDAQSGLLAIVCDGIGGHEGGDVASNLAITSLQSQLQTLGLSTPTLSASQLVSQLELATMRANDAINQRNDQQHKSDRQRMGTTLLIAAVHAHDLYITHVGDSRAYQITYDECYQLTLDDDFATREVRLGNAFYQSALQYYAAGALVQALGISHSHTLHPTTQRFVLDENCVVLLCSDGLSDRDRVEDYWQTEILPVLDGSITPSHAAQRLVQLANTQNGHDNVTVALLHCQISSQPATPIPLPSLSDLSVALLPTTTLSGQSPSRLKTRLALTSKKHSPKAFQSKTLAIVAIGAIVAFFTLPILKSWLTPPSVMSVNPDLNPIVGSPTTESGNLPSSSTTPPTVLEVASLVQTTAPIQLSSAPTVLTPPIAAPSPNPSSAEALPNSTTMSDVSETTIPPGSILKVLKRQVLQRQSIASDPVGSVPDRPLTWVQLQVCSSLSAVLMETSSANQPSQPAHTAGQPLVGSVTSGSTASKDTVSSSNDRQGWILESTLQKAAIPLTAPQQAELQNTNSPHDYCPK